MSDKNTVQWGVLGVAGINNSVLPRIQEANNAELCAIASRSLEKAQKDAKERKIPKAYGSYEELLKDEDIDAVYIPLPNTMHDEWTRKAAEHGKHILCEKPLCPTAEEAQSLIDFCKEKGVYLLDGFMWPHHPRTKHIREFLDSGAIGEVRKVIGSFSFMMNPEDTGNIRLNKDLAGGSLLDIGCYPVYGIRWAMGAEPTKVYASARFVDEVDIDMSGILEFEGDRVASFDCSFQMPYRCWIEIIGTKGSLYVPRIWQPKPSADWYFTIEGQEQQKRVIEGENHIVHMIQNFSRAVLNGEPLQPDPSEAVKSLRVMDALAQSAREGKPIAVPR